MNPFQTVRRKRNPMAENAPRKNMREAILERAIPLFARTGHDGVSMRDVATAVGVTPAALYHHFSDKEQLYLDALGQAFREKAGVLKAALDGAGPPWTRLESFVAAFAQLLAKEKDFQRLMQWALLDSDEQRLHKLADNVFREWFVAIHKLAGELGQGYDAHLLAVTIIGLIVFPFEAGNVHRFLPGYRSRHENPTLVAEHVMRLLRHGLLA
jgi:AcrR family transcriptional regulator